jgi:hypothetical protein
VLYIAEKEICRVLFVFCRSIVGFKGFDETEREFFLNIFFPLFHIYIYIYIYMYVCIPLRQT